VAQELEGRSGPSDRSLCPNCGAAVPAQYCSICGQDSTRKLTSLPGFAARTAGELTDLEGPLWRTIRTLVLLPGRLTKEYSARKFRSQVSPLRLYLAMAGIYYFLLPVWGEWTIGAPEPGSVSTTFHVNFPPRWALAITVPALAALVRVLVPDQKVYYEEAFAFSAHFHVAFLIGFAVVGPIGQLMLFLGAFQLGIVSYGLFLVATVLYIYAALREAFALGWVRSAFSTAALIALFVVVMELADRSAF